MLLALALGCDRPKPAADAPAGPPSRPPVVCTFKARDRQPAQYMTDDGATDWAAAATTPADEQALRVANEYVEARVARQGDLATGYSVSTSTVFPQGTTTRTRRFVQYRNLRPAAVHNMGLSESDRGHGETYRGRVIYDADAVRRAVKGPTGEPVWGNWSGVLEKSRPYVNVTERNGEWEVRQSSYIGVDERAEPGEWPKE